MANTFDDIAILGYACRLPSANDVASFWEVLAEGRCVVTEIAGDRWARERYGHPDRAAAGKTYTWAAGQIDDVWGFDPGFFGISPREAVQIDPQQRLLLQVTWEALEHAGLPPSKLAGSRTGVYVGASSLDYGNQFLFDPAAADVQLMTGNTLSIVSNRISYVYDLRGPSFTVDTACSSSLVALHEALEAIRAGRIDTAVVAGVNLLLSPLPFVGFSRASMLSPTGLCRAFDADGDGYVRSEGAVTIVLRSAAAARAAGDPIRGLIVGSGINADGRTVGLSLPSSEMQATLLREVYDHYEVAPDDVAFIEAHGTGTRVGDPAEAFALGEIIGKRRSAPLPIGSVKTNVGHLEPASGLVGLLKAQLALENDLLPPSLHFTTPNPDIPFGDLNLEVVGQPRALPRGDKARYAGINSFGFGGANAHVVLRDPDPVAQVRPAVADGDAPLVVSAQTREANAVLARRYRDRIAAADEGDVARIVNATAYARERLEHRVVVLGKTKADRLAALDSYLGDVACPMIVEGRAIARETGVVFAFSGNGSQWAGMGRTAYQGDRDFRLAFDRTDRAFMSVAGWSLLTALFSPELDTEIERTEIAQPLLFAVQVALVEALARRGVTPAAVAGHSVGEVAAAYTAGALGLDQAVRVIHARSTQQEVTRHLGGMAALLMPAEKAAEAIADPRFPGIEIAAINSPRSITISGPGEMLDAFAKHARKQRWAMKRLDLDYPFHCALVEPIREPLIGALAGLAPRLGRIPFISSVDGEEVPGTALDADYWWQNVRRPVRFEAAVRALAAAGHRLFLEIGPRPVLTTYVSDTLRTIDVAANVLSSLDKGDDRADVIGAVAAAVLAAGGKVDDAAMFGPRVLPGADLPTYPWQNKPFRIEATSEAIAAIVDRAHPLLGTRLRSDTSEWFNHLDTSIVPWLADHRVEESAVLPAAGFAEMALAAARQWFATPAVELQDLDIVAPMILEADQTRETLVRISHDDHVVEIMSRSRLTGDDWTLHARGTVAKSPGLPVHEADPAEGAGRRITADRLYRLTERFGLRYGPVFRRAHTVDVESDRVAVVDLAPPDPATANAGFALDPTLLDACFHGLFALIDGSPMLDRGSGSTVLPVRFGSLRIAAAGRTPTRARLELVKTSSRSVVARIELFDATGALVARLDGARFQRVALTRTESADELVYRIRAKRLPLRGPAPDATALDPILAALTLEGDAEAEVDEGALLVEAAVRSAAADALVALISGEDGGNLEALIAAGRLAADAHPLASALLIALSEYGVFAEEDGVWTVADDVTLPPVDHIIRTLIAEHPDRIAEAALAARLPGALAERFAGGLVATADEAFAGGLMEHFLTASPMIRPIGAAIVETIGELAAAWPSAAPLRILLAGAHDVDLIRRLAARLDRAATDLTVTDAETSRIERARLRLDANVAAFADVAALGQTGQASFDIVVGAGRLWSFGAEALGTLARALVPGGRFVAIELSPSVVLDAVFGVGREWWLDTADAANPVGRAATGEEWLGTLADAGLEAVAAAQLASDATDAVVLSARRPLAVEPAEPAPQAAGGPAVVIADAEGPGRALADALATELRAAGRSAVVAIVDPDAAIEAPEVVRIDLDRASETASAAAIGAVIAGEGRADVIFALGAADDAVPAAQVTRRLDRLATLLVRLGEDKPRLWILAPGAQQSLAGGRGDRPAQAAIWGFGRVALNEFPDLEIRLLDPAPMLQPGEMAVRLAAEVLDPGTEREIVLDTDRRSGLRIVRGGLLQPAGTAAGDSLGVVLESTRQGIDGLAWRPFARRAPGEGEIEIGVEAGGLNFRDVMWALGLLPEEALEDGFAGPTIGMECAGTVTRVGPGTRRYKVGDRVMAFAPACFASHVTVIETAVAPAPSVLSAEAAATVPVAFLTAYYSLVHLAQLEEGETVLIHGGAGGVGLAALQIARWRGARVIATAGSPEKRALLTALGADHVLNSRNLDFADEAMEITGGAGVDVVLNSLAGEAMERSIGAVKPFGRFLELGKRDYYSNTRIGLRPFRRNISYFGIDADQLLVNKPKLADRVFTELVRLFEDGTLTPLPFRRFEADGVGEAFRLMQQSGHIGKIVVAPPRQPAEAPAHTPLVVREDRSYLVAGGVGGFGFEAARWLAEQGARHIVVASRSGKVDETVAATIKTLAQAGTEIRVMACDLTEKSAVDRLIKTIGAELPPLAGVLHTAMVLDDALIQNLDGDRIGSVIAPKVAGADNLDRATQKLDLDFFVLYSSATTFVGNPGQANYVAANAYLEALARRRRANGKPALAVAWGAIADAGYLARNQEVNALLARKLGRHALGAAEAVDGLAALLDTACDGTAYNAAVAFGRIDWAAARKDLVLLATPLAEEIAVSGGGEDTTAASVDVRALIEGLDPDRALETISKLLAGEIARILRLPADEIDRHRPLAAIGMDSLMALELRMAAEQRLGIDIPLMSLANGATLTDISRRILARLGGGEDGEANLGEDAETLAKSHVSMGDVEDPDAAAIASVVEEHSRKIRKIIG